MGSNKTKTKVAIIGSGNIGTDLMIKIMRNAEHLEMGVMVGIDPASDGLARAASFGFETTHEGVDGLLASDLIGDIGIVFDATSAGAHRRNNEKLAPLGIRMIDLTPAAIGPYAIPAVNLQEHLDAPNVNMVTCGGQATIPIVAAISRVVPVVYGEIVASIASKSAGPGTRANIDEFTETTAAAIEQVGAAARGKAIIILNPAEPPLMMRDTVLALVRLPHDQDVEETKARIVDSVEKMVADVAAYVPGYQLVQAVQITEMPADQPVGTLVPAPGADSAHDTDDVVAGPPTHQVSVFLRVEGAGMYLPPYAGNLDIMTSAAVQMAEKIAADGNPRHIQERIQ